MHQSARFFQQIEACLLALAMVWLPAYAAAQTIFDSPMTQVVSGGFHSCALTTSGGVKCWGYNLYGQLGNATNTDSPTPVNVSGLSSGVVAITAGYYHTCALTTAGGMKCWGFNSQGELGNGVNTNSPTPVDVSGLTSGVAAISAGAFHTCALSGGGGAKCWGQNNFGQLGNGSTTFSSTPVNVSGLSSDVAAISAGAEHSCALTIYGKVKCWGDNANGQVGDSSLTNRPAPADVIGLTDTVSAIAAGGQHTCARTSEGAMKCWGRNDVGQLGNLSQVDSPVAVAVYGLASGVVAIGAGGFHTCAVRTTGDAQCWGYNYDGELGDDSVDYSSSPGPVAGSTGAVASIAPGYFHTCALTTVGGVNCWGDDAYGALGVGILDATPSTVSGSSGIAAVSAGEYHACALTTQGSVRCWGYNVDGQLGNGGFADSFGPSNVAGLTVVAAVSAGGFHSCALATNGRVKCWGYGNSGQLGNNKFSTSVVPVTVVDGTVTPIAGVSACANAQSDAHCLTTGAFHSCAVTTSGNVSCWGSGSYGQLGDNSFSASDVAVAVVDATNTPISGIAAVAAGFYHTCALTTLGDVVCWGDNSAGELGYYLAPSKSSTAVQVVGLPSSKAIAAGFSFSCALTTAGAVECWGYNAQGQLGNNSTTNSPSPVQVSGLTSGVTAISAGLDSACALLSTGAVQCWGYNNGNLGTPIPASPSLPGTVTGLTGGVARISSGSNYACSLLSGSVKCWGSNAFGRLGHPPANTVPAGVSSLSSGVGQLALGFVHTCAMTPEEGMRCWGSNEFGQLGNASISMGQSGLSVVPVAVQGLSSAAVAIATGADHTCAVTANGSGVSCWGDNNRGQLGNNSISATGTASPVAVLDSSFAPIKDVGTLTAGVAHTCALTLTGGVKCWGRGDFGELGDNSKGDSLVAVSVVNGSNVPISAITTIVAGGYHTCALTGAGTVQCWGDDLQGQLGDNDAAKQSKATPANVVGLPGFALSIAAGDFHTCALNTAGAVYCWGSNGSGQLGNTSVAVGATSIVPVPVSGLASGVIAIAAGSTHSCALTTAGAVKCWGANAMGQLGDGTNGQKTTPVGVSGLSVGAVAISAGGDHTCAQTASDALKCWGSNSNGQIGDNMLLNQPQLVPATVSPGQSIKFSPPGNMRVGSLTLSATPSSGLQAAFDTWTPTICQVNGNTLTATASGICGVRASQQGVINATGRGSSIAAAPQQLRLIIVGDPIFADGFE